MRKLVSGLLSLLVLGWAFALPAFAETRQSTQTPPRSPAVQDRADMGIGVTGTGLPADNLRRDTTNNTRSENYRNDMFRDDNRNDNFRTNATNNGRFRATAGNDMDWGWLGLLGLIGLAGLRGRDRQRT